MITEQESVLGQETDDLLLLIQNLREKKALGCLNALDRKLLKKIS